MGNSVDTIGEIINNKIKEPETEFKLKMIKACDVKSFLPACVYFWQCW